MRNRAYWLCQVAGWTLHTLLNLVFATLNAGRLRRDIVLTAVLGGLLALLSSHLIRAVIRAWRWLDLRVIKLLPRVAALSVVLAVLLTAVHWAIGAAISGTPFDSIRLVWLIYSAIIWSLALFLWATVYLSIAFFRRYERAEKERLRAEVAGREAELETLRAQLNPHFLFNALNSVRSMIVQDQRRAQDMITELSELLRYTLQSGGRSKVPLAEELSAVESYLVLERTRFEERLDYVLDVSHEALACQVPPMLLQTLVENAMKHGIARLPEGGRIVIQARLEEGELRLAVVNSGQLANSGSGTHVGLDNARRRLQILFGDAARLELQNRDADHVLATVAVPSR